MSMSDLYRTPSKRLDPKAPDAHHIVRQAARKGFSVTYNADRFGYQFRHFLGKCKFFVADLSQVTREDLDVWT